MKIPNPGQVLEYDCIKPGSEHADFGTLSANIIT